MGVVGTGAPRGEGPQVTEHGGGEEDHRKAVLSTLMQSRILLSA